MRAWVAIAFLAGCEQTIPIDPSTLVSGPTGSDTALAMICESFGCLDDVPRVYYIGPPGLDCGEGTRFVSPSGNCVLGTQGGNGIAIAMPTPDIAIYDTVIVHEVAHWKWGDGDHSDDRIWGSDFSDTWQPGTRVGDMNIALLDAGF